MLRKNVNIIILMLFCAVVLLLMFEGLYAVRKAVVSGRQKASVLKMSRFHPYLQIVPPPNPAETVQVNSFGFRGREIAKKKPANTYRIFLLGGSTTYGVVLKYEETFGAVLEGLLRKKYPGRNIEVLSAGYEWYTTQHSLIRYATYVTDFDPDLVIMFHGINDLYHGFAPPKFSQGEFRPDYGHFLGPVSDLVVVHQQTSPFEDLLLGRLYGLARGIAAKALRLQNKTYEETTIKSFNSLASFKRNINTLINLTRADRVRLILASQPYLYKDNMSAAEKKDLFVAERLCNDGARKPDVRSMIAGMDKFNQAAREISRRRGVAFVDLESVIPKDLAHFIDGIHHTPRSARLIAQAFFNQIVRRGYIR